MQSQWRGPALAMGVCALCAGILVAFTAVPAHAEDHGHHAFHEHDVHRFGRDDLHRWRRGHWHHGWHDGRLGWWWNVGGVWYFYDRPVYPYPLVVSSVAIAEPVVVAPPPPVVVQPPPPAPPAAPGVTQPPPAPLAGQAEPLPAQQPVWYYCDNPKGYYPYVTSCTTPFRPVPAKPQ